MARFGGLATGEQPSPYEVLAEHRVYKLRRYYPPPAEETPAVVPPVVLMVPPMMLAAEIYDVSPATSAVTILHQHGVDPWVVDFGAPEKQEGGLERTLADHVLAVSDAVDRVRELTGGDVHLAGYSQGGMFCYQVAAYRRNAGLGSLITFGSPVDTRLGMPFGLPEQFASGLAGLIADLFRGSALPAWFSRNGFLLLDPVKSARSRIEFVMQLHDRDALLPREGQRRFLEGDGWVAWPGRRWPIRRPVHRPQPAARGRVRGRRTAADAGRRCCPILSVVGTVDDIAPPPGSGPSAWRPPGPTSTSWRCTRATSGWWSARPPTRSRGPPWLAGLTGARGRASSPAGSPWCPTSPRRAGPAVRNRVGYGVELAGAVGSGSRARCSAPPDAARAACAS